MYEEPTITGIRELSAITPVNCEACGGCIVCIITPAPDFDLFHTIHFWSIW